MEGNQTSGIIKNKTKHGIASQKSDKPAKRECQLPEVFMECFTHTKKSYNGMKQEKDRA